MNLFLFHKGNRFALDAEGDFFRLRGVDRIFTQRELVELAQSSPEMFSPNVVLRPLVQDTVLPTAVYIAGPGEVAYLAQFRRLYEWADVPMPAIYPRLSVTHVEGKVRKVLNRYGLSVGDLAEDREVLFKRLVAQEMEVDLDGIYSGVLSGIQKSFSPLGHAASTVDPTLAGAAAATLKNMERELDRLRGRILKAEKRKHDTIQSQVDKALENLYPFGKPQERVLSILHFMARYGPDFVRRAIENMPLETDRHHVVDF